MVISSYFLDELDDRMDGDESQIGRKASHVTKACNACKKRKAKCDRQRPSCGPCQLRREKCEFTEGDRRHHPDRQFVDSLEQRNKALENWNKELDGRLESLVKFIKRMGLEVPPLANASPKPEQDVSKGSSPRVSTESVSPEPEVMLASLSPIMANLSVGPHPEGTEALLHDAQPKLICDERGNHSMYGATSAMQHLPSSMFSEELVIQDAATAPPSPRSKSNSPTLVHGSEPSSSGGVPSGYDHLRHLPCHLHLTLGEHEEMLHTLFRVLPAHMKLNSTQFLRSMRSTLAFPTSRLAGRSPSYPFPTIPRDRLIQPDSGYPFPPMPNPSMPYLSAMQDSLGFGPQARLTNPGMPTEMPADMFTPHALVNRQEFDAVFAAAAEPLLPPQITAHYSPTLHNATLSVALAYSANPENREPDQRREVAQMAKANLETELSLPSVTGVRALAYLASFHAGMSDHALGWQYFGMAIRMAQALGLNLDCTSLVESGDISETLQRGRNTLFWSIYIQDKYWSLWFGRTVALPEGSFNIPTPEPCPAIDLLPMNPGEGVDETTEIGCQPAFLSSTFVQTCKLMLIASKILSNIYGTKKTVDMNVVSRLRLELDDWHNKLPPALHYSTTTLSASIPHILTLQMTFNWLIILLDRPFYRSVTQPLHQEPAVKRCDAALRRIVRLFRSWHDSHGLRLCTPEHSAIIFTAGATFLLSAVQFKPLSEKKRKEGLDGVKFCARLLKEMGTVWPAAKEKAGILFRLQKKFSATVDAADNGMPVDIQRGHSVDTLDINIKDDPEWADLALDLGDENAVPQFVIDTTHFEQSRTYTDTGYSLELHVPSPITPGLERAASAERCNPTLGADFFLTTLYQFMENYETAPQQPRYQAPILNETAGAEQLVLDDFMYDTSDQLVDHIKCEDHLDEDLEDGPLYEGWSSEYINFDALTSSDNCELMALSR
ncbi:hypothetical protein CALCODRAFT_478922 [Calocera cornea HHB12733]|uniref:Zn(2)-C6 fungal-type domain-containing protein n=1 Tax=Calocera cornea HHB12733 TaxID=1353952 RepID=A0A165K3D7_9BASI|nr:hypothetical protein CALCODRAFT_478922 [Calocera cornea HHB12733]